MLVIKLVSFREVFGALIFFVICFVLFLFYGLPKKIKRNCLSADLLLMFIRQYGNTEKTGTSRAQLIDHLRSPADQVDDLVSVFENHQQAK